MHPTQGISMSSASMMYLPEKDLGLNPLFGDGGKKKKRTR
jgi:hypothetical protein